MYKWIRNTHLLLGLFAFLFLLMYGVSSIQMAHNKWFSNQPAITESAVALAAGAADARAVARELMDKHGLKGELAQIRKVGQSLAFRIMRPGTIYDVTYSPETGEAKVKTSVANLMGMLNRIHHINGLWHDFTLTNVWAAFVALVSVALILLSLSGIYLWFKIHTERIVGSILLALSLGYSLTLIVLIRTA